MPSLLEGPIQKIAAAANRWNALDATIYQQSGSYTPGTGDTETLTATPVSQCVLPGRNSLGYRTQAALASDERMLILLQRPLLDAGLTLKQGDEIKVRDVRSEILELQEDGAQAAWTAKVRP